MGKRKGKRILWSENVCFYRLFLYIYKINKTEWGI